MLLQLEEKHRKIVNNILNKYPYQFYAFGSRVKGKARDNSDLDLYYSDNIPAYLSFLIKEEFKESDLPFNVDLVSENHMNKEFKKLIEKDLTLIT